MSTDPHAIIYYGFPLPDFDDPDYLYHEKNDEWEKEKRPTEPADKSDYRTPEWDRWRMKLREWEASPEHIQIEWSGGENCEAYYVNARGLRKCVEWDEQLPLAGMDLGSQPSADEQLKLFCERYGIPWQQPGWHLAALYF